MNKINEFEKTKIKLLKIPLLIYLIVIIVISILSACFICERTNMTGYLSYYRTSLILILVNIISFIFTAIFLYTLVWIITKRRVRVKALFKCVACIGIIYTSIVFMIDMFWGYFIEKTLVILFLKFVYHFFDVYLCLLYVNNEYKTSLVKNIVIFIIFIVVSTAFSIIGYLL